MPRLLSFTLILCLTLIVFPVQAVHKCTDASGQTVYQQSPCQGDSSAEDFQLRSRPAPESSGNIHPAWQCDSRDICESMTSCAEAIYFHSTCDVQRLDADQDGVPCEAFPCDIGDAAPLTIRPGEAAALERTWRQDIERDAALQARREQRIADREAAMARCDEADQYMEVLRLKARAGSGSDNRIYRDAMHDLRRYRNDGCRGDMPDIPD